MRVGLVYFILYLTLLGSSPASGNTNEEGINMVDDVEESFLRRFTVDEDLTNKTATIELHFISIDMLLSVKVDSINELRSVTTTYLPGKFSINEMGPGKEKEKENKTISSNQSQNTVFTNISLTRSKIVPKENVTQRDVHATNSSSWIQKAWNGFSNVTQSFIKWLRIGIEWSEDSNSADKFAWVKVTREDFTCPTDHPVNYSMLHLNFTGMEGKTRPVTSSIESMELNLVPENSEVTANRPARTSPLERDTNSSKFPDSQHTTESDVKKNELRKHHKPLVVFIGHYESEHEADKDSYLPDLSPPIFAIAEYYGIVPRNTSIEHRDNTNDNASFPKTHGNPATELVEEIPSKGDRDESEPWWLKNVDIDTVDTRNHTMDQLKNADKCDTDVKEADADQILFSNFSAVTDLVCLDRAVGVGRWLPEDDNGVCTKDHFLGISEVTPLIFPTGGDTVGQSIVKKKEDKRMTEMFIDESQFCLAGLNKSGPETHFCTKKAVRRSCDTTWFSTKLSNRFMAIVGWRKTSGVHQGSGVETAKDKEMVDILVDESQFCLVGLNKSGPETHFCTKRALRRAPDTSWFTTTLWKRFMAIVAWRKTRDVHQAIEVKKAKDKRIAEILIDEFQFCLAGLNKSGPETQFCTKKAMRRSPETSWYTTRLWNRFMGIVAWRNTRGVHKELPEIPIDVFEICMAGSNKSGPETEFCANKASARLARSPGFTNMLWNKGLGTVRWLTSSETPEKACNLSNGYWTSFNIIMINWTWQNSLTVLILILMSACCLMALYLTIVHIRNLRLRRERELEEEREQLREVESQVSQPVKQIWRPKPRKKKRPNYCGRLQKW